MISERQARIYCYEDISLIENYEKAIVDTTQIWVCHHKVGAIMNCSADELIAKECYYDRPAHELVFLTKAEHSRLHKVGKKRSEETRAKISEAQTGKKHSEETRKKISEAHKGKHHSPEARAKMSAAQIGKKHSKETRAKMSEAKSGENNPMFGRHHSEETLEKIRAAMNKPETRAKMSASIKASLSRPEVRAKMHAAMSSPEMRAKKSALSAGNHWFNNGTESRFCKECPGPEWKRGRLRNKQS